MNRHLIDNLSQLLDRNLVPFMEILESNNKEIDFSIKVYYPMIVSDTCKLLDKEYMLENKKGLTIIRDSEGFHFIDVVCYIQHQKVTIRIHSMLQHTWGITMDF